MFRRISSVFLFLVGACLAFAQAPQCVSTSQDPDSSVTPVDIGTVITLTLESNFAVSATINGVSMTAVSGTPGVDDAITWDATHVAVADTTLQATITNGIGETAVCSWVIDVNCEDPSIVSVAPIGSSGIVIGGTLDCTYTVRITHLPTGTVDDYDVTISNLTNPGANLGTGSLGVVVEPDVLIEVGQVSFNTGTDSVRTVPTLGVLGLAVFSFLLISVGIVVARKNKTA